MITANTIIPAGGTFSQFVIHTTSVLAAWAGTVTNTGNTLRWSVSGDVIIAEVIANNPALNLSANTGTAVITVRNRDRFRGIEDMTFNLRNITYIDISRCRFLDSLLLVNNPALGSINVSQNTYLQVLNLRNCGLIDLDITNNSFLGTLDISQNNISTLYTEQNTQLSILIANNSGIRNVDFTRNTLLTQVQLSTNDIESLSIDDNNAIHQLWVQNNSLPPSEIDAIIIQLDNFGLLGGDLDYSNQNPVANPTAASLAAYNNLIGKGWTITGAVPA